MTTAVTLTIRRRRAEDRAACYQVYVRAVREGAVRYYNEQQRAAWAPDETPDLSKPDRIVDQDAWVAELDGKICGFMTLERSGHLDMAFVLPEVMGKGVADALYSALLVHAKTCGCPRLTVDASLFARSFFARHGWQVTAQELHPHNGQTYTRFQMTLELKEQSK